MKMRMKMKMKMKMRAVERTPYRKNFLFHVFHGEAAPEGSFWNEKK
jgi:hypothetical protein